MKTHVLLITTMLSATMMFGVSACSSKADTVTSGNARTIGHGSTDKSEVGHDARDVAEDFVGNINYARVALAKKDGDRAERHIVEAQKLMTQMQNTTVEERKVARIESGRIVYKYDTDYKYHYFPIATGPMEIKKMGHGPVWAKSDLAVTEADVVYLTVDLSGDKAGKQLTEAEADIKAGNLKAADVQLAKLTDEVITVDDKTSVPVDKARDNIALARNFVASKNYTGARYALSHAVDALDEMQKDDTYKSHHTAIAKMRKDVASLQITITKKDPTMMNKAGTKMDKWWSELKDWSNNK